MGNSILLVEDDLDTQANLCDVLEMLEYEPQIAGTINEAINHPGLAEFDFILLDRNLPDGTADEALPKFRKLAPEAAVVIATGQGDVESTIAALQHGAADYLLKPIHPGALEASLQRIARIKEAEARVAQSERLAGIGQMIAGIAHESRNAMQRIQTAVEMLMLDEDELPDHAKAEVNRIESANQDLQRMHNEIREFSAPINLEMTQESISGIWRQAWRNVADVHSSKTLRLEENGAQVETMLSVDRFRLEQVFRNLFENAIGACESDPLIEVACTLSDETQDQIQIAIRDNGPGIAMANANQVFEPFFTTKQKGTGLGLAIVKRVIDAHGGTIGFVDNGHPGAEVLIVLPMAGHQTGGDALQGDSASASQVCSHGV